MNRKYHQLFLLIFCTAIILSGCKEQESNPEPKKEGRHPSVIAFSGKWESSLSNFVLNADTIEVPRYEGVFIETNKEAILHFISLIEVDEERTTGECCECMGYPIIFKQGTNELCALGLHHGQRLSWLNRHLDDDGKMQFSSGWPGHAELTTNSSNAIMDWMSCRDIDIKK